MSDELDAAAEQAGKTIRASIKGWGPTLRLCVILLVVAGLLAAWLLVKEHLDDEQHRPRRPAVICVQTEQGALRCFEETPPQ